MDDMFHVYAVSSYDPIKSPVTTSNIGQLAQQLCWD